tara:strand:- start:2094 stop:2549 length:456 start_codon:yes stop_codon:yes gene_type:complete
MLRNWNVRILVIDPKNSRRIISISNDLNNNEFNLPGGPVDVMNNNYLDVSVKYLSDQLGIKVKRKNLNMLNFGELYDGVNIITYVISNWKGNLNTKFNDKYILYHNITDLSAKLFIKSNKTKEDEYLDFILKKYDQYLRKDWRNKSSCTII